MAAGESSLEELKFQVVHALETNGVLGQIRAQLRANVYQAIDNDEETYATGVQGRLLKSLLGRLMAEIVAEFLEFYNFRHSLSVFLPETSLPGERRNRAEIAYEAGLGRVRNDASILEQLVDQATSSNVGTRKAGEGYHSSASTTASSLAPQQQPPAPEQHQVQHAQQQARREAEQQQKEQLERERQEQQQEQQPQQPQPSSTASALPSASESAGRGVAHRSAGIAAAAEGARSGPGDGGGAQANASSLLEDGSYGEGSWGVSRDSMDDVRDYVDPLQQIDRQIAEIDRFRRGGKGAMESDSRGHESRQRMEASVPAAESQANEALGNLSGSMSPESPRMQRYERSASAPGSPVHSPPQSPAGSGGSQPHSAASASRSLGSRSEDFVHDGSFEESMSVVGSEGSDGSGDLDLTGKSFGGGNASGSLRRPGKALSPRDDEEDDDEFIDNGGIGGEDGSGSFEGYQSSHDGGNNSDDNF